MTNKDFFSVHKIEMRNSW